MASISPKLGAWNESGSKSELEDGKSGQESARKYRQEDDIREVDGVDGVASNAGNELKRSISGVTLVEQGKV